MKVRDLVASAKASNPDAFKGLKDPRAVRIVGLALKELGRQVEKTAEGPVAVAGFGRFIVKRVLPANATLKQPAGTRRVIFRAAPTASPRK